MKTNLKQWYRASEVASYLGIGRSTVWLYSSQGKITPRKLSSRVTVFHIDEIDRLCSSLEDSLYCTKTLNHSSAKNGI